MKTIYLVKLTTYFVSLNEKETEVINAWQNKEEALKFIKEQLELDRQLNLKETMYRYQIVETKLF